MMMKRLIVLGLVFLLFPVAYAGAQGARVGVLPFTIFSQEDLSYLSQGVQEMVGNQLTSRGMDVASHVEMAKLMGRTPPSRVDERLARSIGRRAGVNFVMFGSLTKVGRQISLDAKLVDVSGKRPTGAAFVQEDGLENLLAATEKLAQSVSFNVSGGTRVVDVKIKGNERIETDAILRILETRKGDVYNESTLSDDMRRVHAMGYFKDIQIDASDGGGGKIVTFTVVENATISRVTFKGNRIMEDEELVDTLGYNLYTIMDARKMKSSVDNMKAFYREKGYYNALITYEVSQLTEKKVAVKYDIDEGRRLYVEKIEFIGNEEYSDRKLASEMETDKGYFLSWLTDAGILNKEVLKEDVSRLVSFYMNNGFIHAKVGEPQVTVDDEGINITITVQEGDRYKVGEVMVGGDLLLTEEELIDELKINEEKYYSREVVQNDIFALRKVYADEGYFYNEVRPHIQENPEEQTVDITYDITKNQLVWIERITIAGNDKTKDKVIRRNIRLEERELFSAEALRQSHNNLQRMGFFEEVQMQHSKGSSDEQINMQVRVKERPTNTFSIGAGYSSYNSVFGTARIAQENLLGTGQQLSMEASVGGATTDYRFSWTDPWLFDKPIFAGVDIFRTETEYTDFDKQTIGWSLRGGYPLFEEVIFYSTYRWETVDITNVSDNASQSIKDDKGSSLTSKLTFVFSRDTRDRGFNPTEGSDMSLTITQAGSLLGGDHHFTRYIADAGVFVPTWKRGWTFFARAKAGYITENQEGGLPIWEKFHLGGLNSVRGFDWYSISPKDPATGDRIGGELMAQFNFELIFPLIESAGLMGVIFQDNGQVWREQDGVDFGDIRSSYGAGVRYFSPIGPLRLEWGKVIDPRDDEPTEQLEFSVGTFF